MPFIPKSNKREQFLAATTQRSPFLSQMLNMLLPRQETIPTPLAMPMQAGWMLPGGAFQAAPQGHALAAKALLGNGGTSGAAAHLLRQGAVRAAPSASGSLQSFQANRVTPEIARRIEEDLLNLPQAPQSIYIDQGARGAVQSARIPWDSFVDSGFDLLKALRGRLP